MSESSDLFASAPQAPKPAAAARARAPLHSDTDIYRAVTELGKHVIRSVEQMRRDVKPTLGKLLVDESVWMGVVVLRANRAREAAKLPHFDELLEQLEIVQSALRQARELKYIANSAYTDAIPLLAAVSKQASGLRNHFAPAS